MAGGTESKAEDEDSTLFAADANCWYCGRAERFGWLVDGEAYFLALRESLEAAEREILIVGWDIASDVELIRDEDHPLYPSPLSATLESLVERKEALRVYVLSWDFAMVYVLERELLPAWRFGWRNSDRLHFELDGEHATGASHHQKFVVIDGRLAYTGGFDLTRNRWDTREHAAEDGRRVNPQGEHYRPFHDVQAILSGEPAERLRDLGSWRWAQATGEYLPELGEDGPARSREAWPEDVPVRGSDVTVAIARTWSSSDGGEIIREVESLFLDMIGAAERHIYIENQYFTSAAITEALCERLAENDGPAILIVLPAETSGWLEQATMDVLRNDALSRLVKADRHDRLRVMAPVSDELTDDSINVHAKIMVVDDRWVRIGSANLSRRSMGLDSECDVVAEDASGELAMALIGDLLGEHLGADPGRITEVCRERGLLSVVDEFNGGRRRLEPLDAGYGEIEEVLEPVAQIADLEKPIERSWQEVVESAGETEEEQESPAEVVADTEDVEGGRAAALLSTPALGWSFLVLLTIGVVGWAIYTAHGVSEVFDPFAILDALRESASHPLAALAVIPAFVVGSLVVAPVLGMIALCGLVFEPWIASVSAIAGTLVATAVNYEIGRHLGRATAARAPRGVMQKMQALGRSSDAWSLAGLRLIPIAPFTIINLLAGACHVRLRDFLLGTLLGMGPGTVLICFSVDRARAALRGEPVFDPWLLAVIAAAGASLLVLRMLQNRQAARDAAE